MKLIALLKLLMPEQMVKIYNPPDVLNTPDYEGEAGSTPWWLAEMEIDKSVGIATDEDGFLEITVQEEKAYGCIPVGAVPLGACSVSTADYQHKPYSFIVWKHEDSSTYK